MKRFQAFHGGPKDGHLEYYRAVGPFPAQVLTVFAPPAAYSQGDPDPHAPAGYTTGVYLLAGAAQSQRHGGMVATYRWQRQRPAAHRPARPDLTVAELHQLTKALADHPDLHRRDPCP
jgi:hypothetical protein